MTRIAHRAASVVLLILAAVAKAQTPAPPSFAAGAVTGECPARLMIQNREQELYLVRIEKGMVFFRPVGAPAGTLSALRLETIQSAWFPIELEEYRIFEATLQRQWETAANILLAPLEPTLPFLILPDNNALAPVMEAGLYLMRAAAAATRGNQGNLTPAATALYERALRLFSHAAKAEWSPDRQEALLRAAMCQTACGRFEAAEKLLSAARLPDPGDGDYGLYHLARASLLFAQGRALEAANDVALSVAFENKDLRVFPDALLLSARAHEAIMDYYRARDIYFEVARLFGATEWGEIAVERLTEIMANGLTDEKEKANIAKVFFGSVEDVNAVVREFLKRRKPTPESPLPNEDEPPAPKDTP